MRLSSFILENMEAILQQWEDFARSFEHAQDLSIEALRDDAERMLRFVAADIESEQTQDEEFVKAKGLGPALPRGESSAAHQHGVGRAADRFSLIELVSEYRALRASVTRMWIGATPITLESVGQLVRFNEAIDQILAEGVMRFSESIDRDADLFTASIGHDLSNPVNAVAMSARGLAASRDLSPMDREMVSRIERSTARMGGMLSDLRDFTRSRLGGLVHIDPEACDVAAIVRNVVDELAAIHSDAHISVECSGDLHAQADARRITQLLSNLVANALQHGRAKGDVTIVAEGNVDAISVEVHNSGGAIEADRIRTVFDPLTGGPGKRDDARLGLGLYIARQIVRAHGGTIGVRSAPDSGTSFTVRLPRIASGTRPSAEP